MAEILDTALSIHSDRSVDHPPRTMGGTSGIPINLCENTTAGSAVK